MTAAAVPAPHKPLLPVTPHPGTVSRVAEYRARKPKPGEASFFFYDPHFRSDAVKVLPGEYYVSADPLVIQTVLGSCIAACIWDPRVRVGGMNHFMLPEGGSDSGGRYGSYAMELLINELMKQGARRETMQAKVFGGGQVMSSFTTMNVGERNTSFVLDYLQTERIAVVSKDVLDIHPRKVCFFPSTGKAMVKRLAHSHPETLETQERKGSAATVVTSTAGGSIDLF
ncbi:MAG: chemoreceptor glutamine deamidase CheD [Hydrogenophaga sp.]|uniref:Probable chemoreceptor glutamine deamidase CheD n=1 Tax=Hydrogenophaga crocea TaxID=2716225 RepID=A0A6G8IM65_9BURK|nr:MULTISPECIES: chemoreceptor glutamine deamidase CheD [Hydrogenophaga]MBL0943308.1 chemoreceptor glutamine deamidase CheD [Hydrogenophaga sp.]QIM54302.1 chemoreceptor glutamine deamidase CheD [Hydrogenophaga crocea]